MEIGVNTVGEVEVELRQNRDESIVACVPSWFAPEMREPFELRFPRGTTLAFVEVVVKAAVKSGRPYGDVA